MQLYQIFNTFSIQLVDRETAESVTIATSMDESRHGKSVSQGEVTTTHETNSHNATFYFCKLHRGIVTLHVYQVNWKLG